MLSKCIKCAIILTTAAWLAACSTVQTVNEKTQWVATGKVQFRDKATKESFNGSFQWQSLSDGFELNLQAPLGAGSMQLSQEGNQATLALSDGSTHYHENAGELISAALNQPIPIDAINDLLLAPESSPLPRDLSQWQVNRRNYQSFEGFETPIATRIDLTKDSYQIKLIVKSLKQQ